MRIRAAQVCGCLLVFAAAALAQTEHPEHEGHQGKEHAPGEAHQGTEQPGAEHSGHQPHQGMEHAGAEHGMEEEGHMQHGMLGGAGSREASGTSWQPESTPMEGIHFTAGDWSLMLHGFAFGVYDDQGGKRGDDDFFSTNMAMLMAHRALGPGTLGGRAMLSLEAATIGREGYPLLLQTGETADGRTPLIDRQHPHDLFMELAATYSLPLGNDSAVFAYFGLPGEPALGPPTFMHRFSGADNPEAPLTHHWLDSAHITFGVATVGAIWRGWKLDASIFTGREPDQNRWDFDDPKFDSYSGRLSYNPTKNWAFQISYGWLKSPEQLEPDLDVGRITASVSYNRPWGKNNWQTTFAWGRNMNDPGRDLDGFLLETALNLNHAHTIFARAERVRKDELFLSTDPMFDQAFTVNKISLGYIYDLPVWYHMTWGLGALGSVHVLPERLEPVYSDTPLSVMAFARVKLQ